MKSRGAPTFPVAWLTPRRQCSRKPRRNRGGLGRPRPRDLGPSHPRGGQGALHGVGRMVVELMVLFGSPPPVEDVRLVPDLPVPLLNLRPPVAGHAVRRPLEDQLAPLAIIAGRIGPAGGELAAPRRPVMPVRLGLDGERLGHEADLDVGPEPPLEIGVEDPVHDRPVVPRAALGILGIGVRRAPLQGRRAVAGGQQVVRPDEDRARAQARELIKECLSLFHVRVIGFVMSEEPPGGAELARRSTGVDRDRDGGLVRMPGTRRTSRWQARPPPRRTGISWPVLSAVQKVQELKRVGDDFHCAACTELFFSTEPPRRPHRDHTCATCRGHVHRGIADVDDRLGRTPSRPAASRAPAGSGFRGTPSRSPKTARNGQLGRYASTHWRVKASGLFERTARPSDRETRTSSSSGMPS